MNKTITLLLLSAPFVLLPGCVVAPSQPSRMEMGGSYANGDMNSFYFSLSEYYGVPERDVIYIHERRIPDNDIPVILFISQRARVAPSVIVNLRLSGRSWMDISLNFGLGPDIYYVPAHRVYGPPYGHAYGHFQNRHRNEWHKIRLSDDDVVNLTNLRFISEHHGYPPDEVVRMRSSGRDFAHIHNEARRNSKRQEPHQQERRDYRGPQMQQERNEREYRPQDRREMREPALRQERQEQETRQQERRDGREPRYQQDRTQQENSRQERRDTREPLMQRERQERETRQQERGDSRDAAIQQGSQPQEARQSERRSKQEEMREKDRQKKESRKKDDNSDENAPGQDRKNRGQRGIDEPQSR